MAKNYEFKKVDYFIWIKCKFIGNSGETRNFDK